MILELLTFTALTASVPDAPAAGTDCGVQVCIYSSSGDTSSTWKTGQRLSRKKRRADAKKNKKRKDVGLSVTIAEEGRGSVFVDGRYLATTGPHAQRALKPGKHEVEVRDGNQTLAIGVLVLGRKAGSVRLVVNPSRG